MSSDDINKINKKLNVNYTLDDINTIYTTYITKNRPRTSVLIVLFVLLLYCNYPKYSNLSYKSEWMNIIIRKMEIWTGGRKILKWILLCILFIIHCGINSLVIHHCKPAYFNKTVNNVIAIIITLIILGIFFFGLYKNWNDIKKFPTEYILTGPYAILSTSLCLGYVVFFLLENYFMPYTGEKTALFNTIAVILLTIIEIVISVIIGAVPLFSNFLFVIILMTFNCFIVSIFSELISNLDLASNDKTYEISSDKSVDSKNINDNLKNIINKYNLKISPNTLASILKNTKEHDNKNNTLSYIIVFGKTAISIGVWILYWIFGKYVVNPTIRLHGFTDDDPGFSYSAWFKEHIKRPISNNGIQLTNIKVRSNLGGAIIKNKNTKIHKIILIIIQILSSNIFIDPIRILSMTIMAFSGTHIKDLPDSQIYRLLYTGCNISKTKMIQNTNPSFVIKYIIYIIFTLITFLFVNQFRIGLTFSPFLSIFPYFGPKISKWYINGFSLSKQILNTTYGIWITIPVILIALAGIFFYHIKYKSSIQVKNPFSAIDNKRLGGAKTTKKNIVKKKRKTNKNVLKKDNMLLRNKKK